MWFKNLNIYRLPAPWVVDPAEIEVRLEKRVLQRCGAIERETQGWLPPRAGSNLLHKVGDHWILCLGLEQKLLPSSVVNEFVKDRAMELEESQGFKLGRKQLRDLKDTVIDELLPRAFVRRRTTRLWIDPIAGWLLVDASSESRAEEALEVLRESLMDLPVRRLDTERSPESAMTEWVLSGEAPIGFTLDRDLELRSPDEQKATVRYVRHALEGGEISGHISGGKRATKLALTWREKVSLVLTEQGQIKRLAFLDSVLEGLDGQDADAAAEFDAQFALMAGELRLMLAEIAEALGGERTAAV